MNRERLVQRMKELLDRSRIAWNEGRHEDSLRFLLEADAVAIQMRYFEERQ